MVETSEQYLNIAEPFEYDSSVSRIVYLSQDPRIGTDLNAPTQTILTINPTDDWLLPSKSYLYIEGRVLKTDGTRFTKNANGNWPDIALTNNFFPFLYNTIRYTVNDVEVESFNYPGQCTTIKHLLTKPSYWNSSDMGWDIDTFDGSFVRSDTIYFPISIPSASFAAAGDNPTAAEYRVAFRLIISTFNSINGVAVPDLVDSELPSSAASPTVDEMLSGARNIVAHINNTIDNIPIVLPTANIFAEATTVGMRIGLLTLISIINKVVSNKGSKKIRGF
jgi:hypothetical protein